MGEKPISRDEELRRWLAIGGARQIRRSGSAEVYSVAGVDRVRETAAGGRTMVACLLDPSLKLTVRQRATGQCYGAYCEMITGASSDFMREAVDGGRSGGGGYNERVFEMRAMVSVAQTSLATVPAIRYAPAKPRGGGRIGRHWRVKARFLADRVCIDGWSLTAIAVARFWTAQHKDKGGAYRTKVPDRQRKHLAQALRDVLDVIDAAWQDGGYAAPFAFGGIDVE